MTHRTIFSSISLAMCVSSSATATILVDYVDNDINNGIHDASIRNGGFEDVTVSGTFNSFANSAPWYNIGTGDQTAELTRNNLTTGTSLQNAVHAESAFRVIALDTEYTLTQGETVNFSYLWRDAFNWHDASDQIAFTIYTTADDTIEGVVTDSLASNSGTSSADNSYQEHADSLVATNLMDGKRLFISFENVDGNENANGFSRIDNVFVEVVPVPEPGSLALLSLGGLLIARRRRS